jgi:hypothetical protein
MDRLMYVVAFAISGYASSQYRIGRKPFNPLMCETYECIRPDKGFRFISEKVSHYPNVMAVSFYLKKKSLSPQTTNGFCKKKSVTRNPEIFNIDKHILVKQNFGENQWN